MADKVKKQNKKSGPADLYGDTTPKPSNVPQTAGEMGQRAPKQPRQEQAYAHPELHGQQPDIFKAAERLMRMQGTQRRTVGGDLVDPNAPSGLDSLRNIPHSWEQPSHDGVSANLGLEQSRLADIFKSNNQQDIQGPNGQLTRQNQYGIGTNVAPPPVGHPEARGTDPRQGHGMLPSESSGLHDWLQQTFNTQAANQVGPPAPAPATAPEFDYHKQWQPYNPLYQGERPADYEAPQPAPTSAMPHHAQMRRQTQRGYSTPAPPTNDIAARPATPGLEDLYREAQMFSPVQQQAPMPQPRVSMGNGMVFDENGRSTPSGLIPSTQSNADLVGGRLQDWLNSLFYDETTHHGMDANRRQNDVLKRQLMQKMQTR